MNKFTMAALAGMSALVLATPAMAQSDDPAPFSGLYIGGSIGYDAQPNDFQERIKFDHNGSGTVRTATGADAFAPGFCNGQAIAEVAQGSCRNDRDNKSYYARAGFDVPLSTDVFGGGLVIGLVGEFGKSEITDSVSAFSSTPASYTLRREIDYDAGVRARLGYVRNTTMFYATGGGKYAKIDNTFLTTNRVNSFTDNGKTDAWGYSVGGGLEQKLGRHFSIGVEYLFNRVKDDDYRVTAGAGSAPATNPFILGGGTTTFQRSVDNFTWHSGRITAAFRF